jgi:hypothetical protein
MSSIDSIETNKAAAQSGIRARALIPDVGTAGDGMLGNPLLSEKTHHHFQTLCNTLKQRRTAYTWCRRRAAVYKGPVGPLVTRKESSSGNSSSSKALGERK